MLGAEERRLRRMKQYAARRSERLPASGGKATPQTMPCWWIKVGCVRELEPMTGGCGLFRAATISSVPSIGAKNSVGYGGSPLVQILRLA